ncbi:unnamed protein product [Colias eurytheme]|nr:unnamed protein product [Colias eurytheme]
MRSSTSKRRKQEIERAAPRNAVSLEAGSSRQGILKMAPGTYSSCVGAWILYAINSVLREWVDRRGHSPTGLYRRTKRYRNGEDEKESKMGPKCLPLTKQEFLKLAYDLAEALKIPHRFNKEKGAAGKHFDYDFMQRHQSGRIAEITRVYKHDEGCGV